MKQKILVTISLLMTLILCCTLLSACNDDNGDSTSNPSSTSAASEYTVICDANGGQVSEDSNTVIFGKKYILSVPTRTGYTFMGWYYGDLHLTDSNGLAINEWDISSDITVTAKWSVNKYNVTVTSNIIEAGNAYGSARIHTEMLLLFVLKQTQVTTG